MIKKFILIFIFVFGFANYSLSAGSSDNSSSKTKSNYEKAVSLIKSAKNMIRKVRLIRQKKDTKKL